MNTRLLTAVLLIWGCCQNWVSAGIITPVGLNPGDKFRVFLHTGSNPTMSTLRTDVEYYDGIVQQFVDSQGISTYNGQSVKFQAIASTKTVNANDPSRLSLASDVPIYNYYKGTLVAHNGADFWDGSIGPIGDFGSSAPLALTGTNNFGYAAYQGSIGRYFGTTDGGVGRRIAWGTQSFGDGTGWAFLGSTQSRLSLYGYSEVLTVPGLETPEPASLTLFGLGAIGIAAARRRRQAA